MKNCFIVYYTDDYEPGVIALKNSYIHWQHQADLLIRKAKSRDDALLSRWTEAFETTAYDNVCLLDADMWFANNTDKYFELAAAGLIGAAHNNAFHDFDGTLKLHYNVITNVPLFIQAGHPLITDVLELWQKGCRCDFEACNRCLPGYADKLFVFPSHLWTNIHCSMLKPGTRAVWKYDRLMSEQEEAINMVHGKWWRNDYREYLVEAIGNYYGFGSPFYQQAIISRDLLYREFQKFLN